jgi:hypothetical protein
MEQKEKLTRVAAAVLLEELRLAQRHDPAATVALAWSLLDTQTISPSPTQAVALPIRPRPLAALA